jgi:hypothetical protein
MKHISLSQGLYTLVDDEDFEYLNQFKWYAKNCGKKKYAVRHYLKAYRNKSKKYMHRELLDAPKGLQVDHINGDSLDNRRCNIRLCTSADNVRNRRKLKEKGYKGVIWIERVKKWRANIGHNGKNMYLGYFKNEVDGARAYDKKAKELYGEFANLNLKESN